MSTNPVIRTMRRIRERLGPIDDGVVYGPKEYTHRELESALLDHFAGEEIPRADDIRIAAIDLIVERNDQIIEHGKKVALCERIHRVVSEVMADLTGNRK